MKFLAALGLLLQASCYKFAVEPVEPHELCYAENPECEQLKAAWGCGGTWRTKCPGIQRPEGDDLDVSVATICPSDCPDGDGEATVDVVVEEEMAKANGSKPIKQEEIKKLDSSLSCLRKRMKAAMDMGSLEEVRELLAVIRGETAEKIKPIKDNQTAAAVDMHAREAALHLVEKEFANDEKALQKIKLTPQAVENFAREVESLAAMCEDKVEAAAVRKIEEDALTMMNKSSRAAALAETIKEEVKEKCHARTLNLDYFVEHASMTAGAHCGNSFMQEHHMRLAADSIKELNYRAKAAMALHDDDNRLGHHLVSHFQRHTEHKGRDEERPSVFLNESMLGLLHKAAKAPLSEHHLERLHHLDKLHFAELRGNRDLEDHCQERRDMQKDEPNHWSVQNKDIAAYMDCLCVQRKPALVCEAVHYDGVMRAADFAVASMQEHFEELNAESQEKQPAVRWHRGMHEMSELQAYTNGSQDLGFAIPLGPCDADALSCNICVKGVCLSLPFPKPSDDDDAPSLPGNQAMSVLNALRTGLDAAEAPCFSVDCTACIGLKPGDALKFNLNVGSSGACGSKHMFFSTFVIWIGLEVCISGGPLDKVLKFIKRDQICVGFPTLEYYPFVGKMGVTHTWQPVWLFKAVALDLSAYWPVHGLAPAVKHYCWWHPAMQWPEVSTETKDAFEWHWWFHNQMYGSGGWHAACAEFNYQYPGCHWDHHKAVRACRAYFLEGRRSVAVAVRTRGRDLKMHERFRKDWR
ncbi:unnamed protein product [Symbiodinium sp. CCMP2592]|nr:unnamed protein product [Symbiodinium sp. CCMP2592]